MSSGFVTPVRPPALQSLNVIDQISEVGAKLVHADESMVAVLSREPGIRIVPLHYYDPALAPRPEVLLPPQVQALTSTVATVLTVVSKADGSPIPGAKVVAFTDFGRRTGQQGITDSSGNVSLSIAPGTIVERLYVFPHDSFWSRRERNRTLAPGKIPLDLVDVSHADVLRRVYAGSCRGTGTGVAVGIIDTGCGPHKGLCVVGGLNCSRDGRPANDYADSWLQHGTHVAGIISARGPNGNAIGLSPDVSLRSYRVFSGTGKASSFGIAKAIHAAVDDGCDLINMSLGRAHRYGSPPMVNRPFHGIIFTSPCQ